MNILYINHYAGGPRWGMEYRPYYLAREWVRAGHSVTVVAASQSHIRARQPELTGMWTHEQVDGINYVWCKTPSYRGNGVGRVVNILSFLGHLRLWRQWLQHKPDVVIASSTYPADIAAARRIARQQGAKLVWEVHDLWPLSPVELGGMSRYHPFIMWMQHAENMACRVADVVVSMLPKADQHLVSHGMTPDKFVYVPNGIDPEEWHPEQQVPIPATHRQAIADARAKGHMLVAYAGTHGIANALDTMLDAAEQASHMPVTWLLVGGGPEKNRLAQRVRHEQLAHVVLLDPVHKAAIPTLLGLMDVLYIGWHHQPLYRFGISPNKLMDYMMAGRPVVHSVEAGNDPVGEAGCGITVAPKNPQAVVDAVNILLALSGAERDAMGLQGRAFMESKQTYPVLAQRFLSGVM